MKTLRLHVLITSSGSLPGPAPKLMTLLEGMTDELLSCQLHKQTACRPASDSRLGDGEEARSSDNDMGDRSLSGHLIYKSVSGQQRFRLVIEQMKRLNS